MTGAEGAVGAHILWAQWGKLHTVEHSHLLDKFPLAKVYFLYLLKSLEVSNLPCFMQMVNKNTTNWGVNI